MCGLRAILKIAHSKGDGFPLMSRTMRFRSIATHLRPYRMYARRRTTINHAFAAAVAPSDAYDGARIAAAMQVLGLDPEADLNCAYCGERADTWDHVFATVKDSRFSGHGHRLGNLLPCCKQCNSKKGNKSWQDYLASLGQSESEKQNRSSAIADYLRRYSVVDAAIQNSPDYERLEEIRKKVPSLLKEGDRIAEKIRNVSTTIMFDAC